MLQKDSLVQLASKTLYHPSTEQRDFELYMMAARSEGNTVYDKLKQRVWEFAEDYLAKGTDDWHPVFEKIYPLSYDDENCPEVITANFEPAPELWRYWRIKLCVQKIPKPHKR